MSSLPFRAVVATYTDYLGNQYTVVGQVLTDNAVTLQLLQKQTVGTNGSIVNTYYTINKPTAYGLVVQDLVLSS